MSENTNETTTESILYEVLEYFVRKQEPELTRFRNDSVVLPNTGTIKNALRYLNNRYSLPEIISQQISYTLSWKFAIGDNGRILAILQENIIEIRKSKDEYSSVIGKASAPKDAFPQWRKLVWSPDGSVLALASSNGYVSFYNSFGNNIFNISPKSISQDPDILEAGDATASMIFKKPRVKSKTWDYEFIRVTYSGLLKSYCISENSYNENHEFSFNNFYRNGVNYATYSEKHNLFFVAGNNISQNLSCSASQAGLTCWRTLNDHPYYKLSVASEEIFKTHFSIWNFIPVIKNRPQSFILKTSISPNNQLISCLHTDGTISIWSLPSLKLQKQWKLTEQSEFNAANPLKTMKLKKFLTNISEFQPLDIGWWSDNAVIIARYSGAISVCSTNNLKNLLGTSPEFLYNHPQIIELGDGKGFLCFDCEVLVTSTKRSRKLNNDNQALELSSDSEKDEDESKPVTILNYTKNLMQTALYSITDIEKFQPKRKKSKVFHRTYRVLGIKSTTPEELYSRKIEIEEYQEALALAKTYNLDTDLVYQTQWRKSEFSINAIQEHLSKVSKRSWVLNECVSRVPETLEAARELLNFGLRGANLETLVAIGNNDDGKFTFADTDDETDLDGNSVQLEKMQKVNQILDTISEDNLQESQKELIKYRKLLLDHLDKLKTYEIFLKENSKYNKKFYEEFRQLSPVENAVKFAKTCNCQGVEIMFTYYGTKLIPHWLAVINFFPETLNPEKYQKLLPECDSEGRLFLLDQQELRPKDWVERSMFSDIIYSENDNDAEFIYEDKAFLLEYRNTELTQELLQKWYTNRAYEIEQESRLVDNALALINIGKSHNINGLERLLFELETLDDLVYKVGLEDLSLPEVEKLNDLDKVKLLMKKSNEKNFVTNIKNMLLPFSRRRKRYIVDSMDKNLLYEYLIYLSKESLALPVKFFETLKSCDPEILDTIVCTTTLAIDCIYACDDKEMYPKAKTIYDATISLSNGREDSSIKYKELEKELKCLQTLNKYEVKVPLHYVRESRHDSSHAKALLTQMCENLIKLYPAPNEKHWSQVLNDMLDIQEQTFNCLDIETCFEIAMIVRLKSGSKYAIQGCTNLMEMKKTGRSHLKVSYERALDFILQASSDYFNNAKSLTDSDMELAKECLHLIVHDDERVKEEYDLIESLQILNEFHINILPLQVRMINEKIKLIEECLNSRFDAYKNKQKLLNLSKYLRIEKKNNRLREGKVLDLIAKKAFEVKDYNFCSSVVKQMMKNNYQMAWDIAKDIAYCNEYHDLQFRHNCIWFAINNGPTDMIENLLKRANLLLIQISNTDLERLMPSENFEDNVDTKYSEDYDAKLKLCQTLLRINLLSETASYGAEVNDVNHLLLECAKYIISEDYSMGLSYLLNLHDDSLTNVMDLFEELPKNELYSQMLAYFCSIKLYSMIYSDLNKIFLYDPIELIRNMSNLNVTNLNHDQEKLKQQINFLIQENDKKGNKNLKIEKNFKVENVIKNEKIVQENIKDIQLEKEEKLSLDYEPSTEELDAWDSWGDSGAETKIEINDSTNSAEVNELNIDDTDNKEKLTLDYEPSSEELDAWDSWGDSTTKINMESENINASAETNEESISNTQLEKKEKITLNYNPPAEELDEWNTWGNSEVNLETENIIESTEVDKEITNDNQLEKKEKITLDYNPPSEELDEWNSWDNSEVNIETENRNEEAEAVKEIISDDLLENKEKITLDYNPPSDELDEWNSWDNSEINLETENIIENAKAVKEITSDNTLEKKEKITLDYNPPSEELDEWNSWGDSVSETNIESENVIEDSKVNEDKIIHNQLDEKEKLTLEYNPSSEEVNEWRDDWGDDNWAERPDSVNSNIKETTDPRSTSIFIEDDKLSKEKRYEIFVDKFSKIESIEEYKNVKQMLLKWPSINNLNPENDENLALKMILKVPNIIKNNNNASILQEIKDFLCEDIIPQDVFINFLQEKKDNFTPEQVIYLQLCSKEPSLQQIAVNCIKENYKALNLDSAILEEIFFNNLTSLFSVSHDLYYRILEEVFLNRTLSEIEDNVKLLIDNLVKQKNIPHAIALLNQLEGIPPSLSTYSNCFELLLRK